MAQARSLGLGRRSLGSRRQAGADSAAVRQRLTRLIEVFGNNHLAEILGVSPSQPSRWKRGIERIGAENARKVIDLDYVAARLLQVWEPEVAEIWLRSHNAHLGARPVDVLVLRGAAPVIDAIDAEAAGAYA